MLKLIFVFWCCMLCTQYENVVSLETVSNPVTAQAIVNGDDTLSKVYVKSEETMDVEPEQPIEMESVPDVARYKRSLLENTKNESLPASAKRAYKAIDEINAEYSLNAFVLEACELEKHYFDLKKAVDLASLYERLSNRVNLLEFRDRTEDDRMAVLRLQTILSEKLSDVKKEYNLIVDVPLYTEVAVWYIEMRIKNAATPLDITDVELRNNLAQLQFGVNANYILDNYYHVIDAFRLNYFPFAVDYLETYRLPISFMAYADLNATSLAATNKLRVKHNHYRDLKKDYNFTPVAFESLGPMGSDTKSFLTQLGKIMRKETGEPRSLEFLLQKISISIQRGNAACVLGTFGKNFTDSFLLK